MGSDPDNAGVENNLLIKAMNKTLLVVATMMAAIAAAAQPAATDTVPSIALSEVEVLATRASENTPVAFTNISGKQLAAENHGLDIPFLLTMTPSVITTSDAGAGVGYTSMRVRGTDATRINITVNDIPRTMPRVTASTGLTRPTSLRRCAISRYSVVRAPRLTDRAPLAAV